MDAVDAWSDQKRHLTSGPGRLNIIRTTHESAALTGPRNWTTTTGQLMALERSERIHVTFLLHHMLITACKESPTPDAIKSHDLTGQFERS